MAIVKAAFRAFERDGLDDAGQRTDPNIVITRVDPDGAVFHGLEGFAQAIREWTEDFSEWTQRGDEFIDAGDRVIVRGHQSARGSASGAWVEGDFWYVFTLSEGRITQLDIYLSRDQAIQAAGLSE